MVVCSILLAAGRPTAYSKRRPTKDDDDDDGKLQQLNSALAVCHGQQHNERPLFAHSQTFFQEFHSLFSLVPALHTPPHRFRQPLAMYAFRVSNLRNKTMNTVARTQPSQRSAAALCLHSLDRWRNRYLRTVRPKTKSSSFKQIVCFREY